MIVGQCVDHSVNLGEGSPVMCAVSRPAGSYCRVASLFADLRRRCLDLCVTMLRRGTGNLQVLRADADDGGQAGNVKWRNRGRLGGPSGRKLLQRLRN